MGKYDFSWRIIEEHLPDLIKGLIITLQISVAGMAFALLFGLFFATLRFSQYRILNIISNSIVQVGRSLPLFVLLFWIYYGLSLKFKINFTDFQAGAIALGITGGAYMAEVFRGGIKAIEQGQSDAAFAIGLNRMQTSRLIVLPQAIRIILPQTVNIYVGLLKGATIVSVIGVADMIYVAQYVSLETFRPFELYSFAGVVFIALTLSVASFAWLLERQLSGKSRRG
jgi:His/Glu/Gln/Arg/opine family amino acid ABC transporter permease subunit